MKIRETSKNKRTKYNHVSPVSYDLIPESEREQALMEFAEGSVGLEKCLRAMWQTGLITHACCAGNDYDYKVAYIAMSDDVDLFSYLSADLINDELIKLEKRKQKQIIRFAGLPEKKEKLMLLLANDILEGKKNNEELIKEKVGKEFPYSWIRESFINKLKMSNLSKEEFDFQLRGFELNWIMSYGTQEEINKILPEFREHTRIINERLLDNYDINVLKR